MSKLFIGLMSGTSLDSIDAVAVEVKNNDCTLIAHHSSELPPDVRQQILQLTLPGGNEIDQMGQLDLTLGRLFAKATNGLLSTSGLSRESITAIGSHGQTIRHRPEHNFTLQIGDPNTIAELTGITTIADFRRRDMAAGGQGAPLVPAFHNTLFRSTENPRLIANIGGMSNVTLLPANASETVMGYDTGPGNVLLDSWIKERRGLAYDKNGEWAKSGTVHQPLLETLLKLPFFQQTPPKSTGREQFNLDWLKQQLSAVSEEIPEADVQATLLEYTARTLSDAIKQHQDGVKLEVFVCGGGAHNKFLLQRLHELMHPVNVTTTSALGVDPDWVEAIAFAWLASRTLDGLSGNLSAVTGAKGERILGGIYPA